MEFRLLGAVEAYRDGRYLELGHARRRSVLAVLLLDANRVVPVDDLIDRVWSSQAPQRARETLRGYLSRLRGVLTGDGDSEAVLIRRTGGYMVSVDPLAVDLHRFRHLVARARASTDVPAADLFEQALALHRGEPFAGLNTPWLNAVRDSIARERAAAELDRNDIALRRGRHHALLAQLTAQAATDPLNERLGGQLMLALHRSGQQADALRVYHALRVQLAEELGVDPGAPLRLLYLAIMRDDPALAIPQAARPVVAPPVPAQLPMDVYGFTGRADELASLDRLLDSVGAHASVVVVSAIAGTAGVGKTALAVHWAHRVADRFPDGQLFVNLHGYDAGHAVAAETVLAEFLRGLGEEAGQLPPGLAERAARYRSLLHERRMLVVLDNARDEQQVRPLLPGTGSCLVLVTSRDRLSGLSIREGARRVDLDALPPAESIDLLRTLIGARVDAEPSAALALADQCARLPLVLRIAAELAALRPDTTLRELVAELTDERHRLDLFDSVADEESAVRAVLSWSYGRLPSGAARLFRLLGLHPGAGFDRYAAAALAGIDLTAARLGLDTLVRAHLAQASDGRYRMHDLLRVYAAERAAQDPEAERSATVLRLVDYYLNMSVAAVDVRYPRDPRHRPSAPAASEAAPAVDRPELAQAWLDTERPNLVAVCGIAADHGLHTQAIRLAATLVNYLQLSGHLIDALTTNSHALRAAREGADNSAVATSCLHIAGTHMLLEQYDEAAGYYAQALAGYEQAGDRLGVARALSNIGWVHAENGRYAEALDTYRRSLAAHREIGNRPGEAAILGWIGLELGRAGRYDEAVEHLHLARSACREIGDRLREVEVLSDLSQVLIWAGRRPEAVAVAREGIALARDNGGRLQEPTLLNNLAESLAVTGAPQEALNHFQAALDLATEIGQVQPQTRAREGIARLVADGYNVADRMYYSAG